MTKSRCQRLVTLRLLFLNKVLNYLIFQSLVDFFAKARRNFRFTCRYSKADYSYYQEMIKFKKVNWPFMMPLTLATRNGE